MHDHELTPGALTDLCTFEDVLTHYARVVRKQVSPYGADADEVDDLCQLVWIEVWQRLAQCRDRKTFAGWLRTICRTVGIRAVRGRRIQTPMEAADVADAHPAADEILIAEETNDNLLDIIARLPPRQRETVVMRGLLGYSIEEVSLALRCRPGTVKATFHAAKQTIQLSLPCEDTD